MSWRWMDGKSSSGQIAKVSTTSGPLGATLIEPVCACLPNREIGMIMLTNSFENLICAL